MKLLIKRQSFKSSFTQQGMVLVVALLLLLILTMTASLSLEGSQFAYKMSVNRLAYDEALTNSESARKFAADSLHSYLSHSSSAMTSLPSMDDKSLIESESLPPYLHYNKEGATGDVYVLTRATTQNSEGSGSSQYQGYRGAGIGMAGGGSLVKYYEVRSIGYSSRPAGKPIKVWTASDYRFVL